MDFLSWLKQGPNRKDCAEKYHTPGLVAYYWDGAQKKDRLVQDISSTTAYLCSPERWYVGTIISITFQRKVEDGEGSSAAPSITLPCRVVRDGPDGFEVSFMFHENKDRKALEEFIQRVIGKRQTPGNAGGAAGQAL
jgi:hypothetical protein